MTNEFVEDTVDELLPDYPEIDRHTRPALAKLADDQNEILVDFIEGFDDRRALLRWSQDAIVGTLGELDDQFCTDLAMSRSDLSTLLRGEGRCRWSADPPTPEAAKTYRRALAAEDLVPSFRSAYRKMRWSATEYVNDEDDDFQPDPSIQAHPAMRPALSEMSQRQEWALDRCLEGFADQDELMSWVLRTVEASHGEIDDDLASDLYTETHTRRMLVTEPEDHVNGPFFRASFAATTLLPAFTRAARKLSEKAGELAEQEKREIQPTPL